MGITNWSIRHSITIFVLILVLGISGYIAYQSLPREAEPDITIPFIMVTTPYIGVAPADIEALVTDPIEEELEQLRDVREITSTSAEGASIIAIEFEPGVDIDDALQKVRDRVMAQFREGKVKHLVATDVVGRGIDVSGISTAALHARWSELCSVASEARSVALVALQPYVARLNGSTFRVVGLAPEEACALIERALPGCSATLAGEPIVHRSPREAGVALNHFDEASF